MSRFAIVGLALSALLVAGQGCSSAKGANGDEAKLAAAKAQYDAGQFAKSEKALTALLEKSPDNQSALRTLALALAAQGKNDAAISQYERLVSINAKDHASWYRMALLERILGRADDSVEHLEKALAHKPGDRSYTDELARTNMSVGDYDGAARLWGSLIKSKNQSRESKKELLLLQAQAFQDAKDYDSALASYKKALKLDPKDKALAERIKSFK